MIKRISTTLALTAVTSLALAACGGGGDPLATGSQAVTTGAAGGSATEIVVGSANFPENVLLAEIYAGALNAAGVKASTKLNIGAREILVKALEDGSVSVTPEYTGGLAFYYLKDKFTSTEPDAVYADASQALPASLKLLTKSAAEDNDSVTVTKATAAKYNLKSIADLAPVAKDLTIGALPEFKTRAQGLPGVEKNYGVTFKSFRPLGTTQAVIQALKNGQIDAANIYTTDPSIAENGFVTLEDPKKNFGSQNVVPLVRADIAAQVQPTLDKVSAALTTPKLAEMLKETDIDKKDPAEVAKAFLAANGLG